MTGSYAYFPKALSDVMTRCGYTGSSIGILSKNRFILTGEFKSMATVACTQW